MKQLRSTFILFTLLSVITLFAQDKKQSKEYPVIKFEQTTHDFGTFSAADPIQTCVFKFYNVGKEKLVINYVHTSCGCTAADYTKTPISPGASGEIKVTYDAHILSAQKPGDIKTGDIKTGRVSIVEITINDAGDHRVRSSRNEIICKIEGPAVLLGLEGANNSDMSNYRDNHQPAYRGRLVAYIRRTGSAPVRITFSSEGLESKVITL